MTLEEARNEARGIWEVVARRRAATKKLSKIYERMTPEMRDELASRINFECGALVNLDNIFVDPIRGHDKYLEHAMVMRPLVDWWRTQGKPLTTTVYSNPKRTDRRADDGASESVKWLANEMSAIGIPTTRQAVATMLGHLSISERK